MKKLLLGLGALTAVIAPVATVVACGTNEVDEKSPITQGKDGSKTLTIDITGATKDNAPKIKELSNLYDEYVKLMTVDSTTRLRSHDVILVMVDEDYKTEANPTGSYSYIADKKPSKCKMPDPTWEHLVTLLETLTGKPGVADLILDE